jgi:NitT/TauT family transport system substrate-binding protein
MRRVALAAAFALALAACGDRSPPDSSLVLRVGHFANVTHAHGVIAHHRTRVGKGWFEERLGPGVRIDWYVYNAGPLAMEAMLSGDLDLTYVGPSPVLNAHIRSKGEDVRVVSGATRGGAGLVVHEGASLATPADFRGKRLATPQLGNTQDVAARAWLVRGGLRITQTGGDANVVPTANPDQLSLFQSGFFDGVWTVEPWVSRLELEAGGHLVVEDTDSITTLLASSARALVGRRDLVRRFVAAHRELTAWIAAHPDEAKAEVAAELAAETHQKLSDALLSRCWPRLHVRDDVAAPEFEQFVRSAKEAGFLRDAIPLDRLVESP